jgi:hypothetical protein
MLCMSLDLAMLLLLWVDNCTGYQEPTVIYLISAKQCSKVISQTGKFVFFEIHAHSKQKVVTTSVVSTQSLSLQQKQVDRIMEE